MKLITLFIAATFLSFTSIYPGTNWLTNFDQAKTEAFQENKFILLNFSGSDWCAPCIRLKEEIFSSEIFTDYADKNLVLAIADFPRLKKNQLEKTQVQHNEALAEKYNPDGKFPLTILLNASGKPVKEWEGFSQKSPEQFIAEINKLITAAR